MLLDKSQFNRLEKAALNKIGAEHLTWSSTIRRQISSAIVRERDNSGSGFFTYFSVYRATAPVRLKSPIGDTMADLAGWSEPFGFLLFFEEGYAACLECASFGDYDTRMIDFNAVEFVIPSRVGAIVRLNSN